MSRRKPADNSTAVSLFPFLAVLLCTMGALLVVLVAVSRAAREAALRKGSEQQQTAAVEEDPAVRRELEQIESYNADLKQLRDEAQQRLRDDQLRTGQLENHMRRLQDQLDILQAAAAELDAMEEEHYDDREQAQREIERLERLIAETRRAVEALKEQVEANKQTYALIPYEGPNGTFRRPIYIECRKDELILQPEGVRVKREDLYPPFGAGNPLAAALRAARDYYVRLRPAEGQSRDTEPYPLLVVRPEGLLLYDRARRAIESSDFEFGFELVEEDWELTYPVADPKLASIEQQAIDQARIRQRALAAAAPRAYRHALAVSGRFEPVANGEDGFGFSGAGASDDGGMPGGGSGIGDAASDNAPNDTEQAENSNDGTGDSRGNGSTSAAAAPSAGQGESAGVGGEAPDGNSKPTDGGNTTAGGGAETAAAASPNSASAAGAAGGESAVGPNSGNHVVVSSGGAAQPEPHDKPQSSGERNGRDWALGRKKPNAVPIRRTIQVIVRSDHVAILAEDAQVNMAAPGGKRIEIPGDTVESLDPFVTAVQQHIDGWGIAGEGLYWRPVLNMHVGPDGRRRAEDLARLLKHSGLELRTVNVANREPQGESRATR